MARLDERFEGGKTVVFQYCAQSDKSGTTYSTSQKNTDQTVGLFVVLEGAHRSKSQAVYIGKYIPNRIQAGKDFFIVNDRIGFSYTLISKDLRKIKDVLLLLTQS